MFHLTVYYITYHHHKCRLTLSVHTYCVCKCCICVSWYIKHHHCKVRTMQQQHATTANHREQGREWYKWSWVHAQCMQESMHLVAEEDTISFIQANNNMVVVVAERSCLWHFNCDVPVCHIHAELKFSGSFPASALSRPALQLAQQGMWCNASQICTSYAVFAELCHFN